MKKTDLKTANYSHRSDSADVSPDSSEIKLIKIMSKFVLLSGGFQRDCDKEQILQKSSLCSRESEQSNYENNIDQTNQGDVSSHQELKDLHKEENALGYGCIRFSDTSSCDHAQPYIRIPMPVHRLFDTSFPTAEDLWGVALRLLYYVENVWELQAARQPGSITGGAQDFEMDSDKENVLYQLIEAERKTQAWLVTGGTSAGIMSHHQRVRRSAPCQHASLLPCGGCSENNDCTSNRALRHENDIKDDGVKPRATPGCTILPCQGEASCLLLERAF